MYGRRAICLAGLKPLSSASGTEPTGVHRHGPTAPASTELVSCVSVLATLHLHSPTNKRISAMVLADLGARLHGALNQFSKSSSIDDAVR